MNPLHIKTPLLESTPLSRISASRVWLKMEAMQPSGSFKLRGIGRVCHHHVSRGVQRLISSSGGNAGLAVAYCGRKLGVPVTVVVPVSTPERAIDTIRSEQAEVVINGESWQEAHDHALSLCGPDRELIHPFDDPLLWEGHATLIDEVAESGLRPDAVVLSVGGGGLLCGVVEGLHKNGLSDTPVLAVETDGAASLAGSLSAGSHVELERIATVATSLGAKKVAAMAWEWCSRHEIISHCISDLEAVESCLKFVDDHRVLVEPACGAALAPVYCQHPGLRDKNQILLVVCGGVGVSLEQLTQWKNELKSN
ncbi:MAG: pyridoxal-phosphate dependent enzyme [Desulfofustis sp.]|nr:pyridoxal-phosphate dependent enzyme [Desulfofustis sp.]